MDRRQPHQGIVYFLYCEGFVKIGHCGSERDLRKRLAGIAVGNPFPISVMRTLPGTRQHEKWLHNKFNLLRVRGEWFAFCEQMLEIVPPSRFLYNDERIAKIIEQGDGKLQAILEANYMPDASGTNTTKG